MEACSFLIGQFEERNAELEWAAVSGEDRCVTTLITAAKETSECDETFFSSFWHIFSVETKPEEISKKKKNQSLNSTPIKVWEITLLCLEILAWQRDVKPLLKRHTSMNILPTDGPQMVKIWSETYISFATLTGTNFTV